MRKVLLAVVSSALIGTVALATEPAPKGRPDKIICRTESAVGSRLAKTRACHTPAEWAELRRQTRENVQNIQDRRTARISDDPAGGM